MCMRIRACATRLLLGALVSFWTLSASNLLLHWPLPCHDVHLYIHLHIFRFIYVYIHTHTQIYTHKHTHLPVCVRVGVCVYECVSVWTLRTCSMDSPIMSEGIARQCSTTSIPRVISPMASTMVLPFSDTMLQAMSSCCVGSTKQKSWW